MPSAEASVSVWGVLRRMLVAAAALGCAALVLCARAGHAQEAGTAVYVRTDSDRTTVIAPRLRVAAPVGENTRVDLVYTMDVWTSASIDIRTSASKPITEQRDEIDVQVRHELPSMSVKGGYRFSKEPDYESHGGTLGVSRDFADKSATLALDVNAIFDTVGRVGDPGFARASRMLNGRLSFTQILNEHTLVQAIYELSESQGYLSSPYRFVGIKGKDGLCTSGVAFCVPETNPDQRLRHALAVRGRRAFGKQFSVGAGYRFYIDDWSLMSHTIMAELAFLPEPDTILALRYRFYMQNAAAQYQPHYEAEDQRFYTNDKELSTFTAHRVALDLEHAFLLDDPNKRLRAILSVAPTLYRYSDFLPLPQITALEVTLATVLQL
jgi:hypothetical protein